MVETKRDGTIVDENVFFQFDHDSKFDPEKNAQGKLILLLKGKTKATRYFHVYFDTSLSIMANQFPAQVKLQDQVPHEGQDSYKITTNSGVYIYHKQGAGFASLVDREGKDWISYHPGGKSAGEYRGIPNLGDFGHPGYTNSRSKILSKGPLKVSILSETTDGKSAVQWDIFPNYARMTILKAAKPYWFLYEGTPAGKLDLDNAFVVNSEGDRKSIRDDWQMDLPAPEWVYFGDKKTQRTLFLVNHDDDDVSDQFWQMNGEMTVFGFGRQYKCCERYLRKTPAQFTIGLVESADFQKVSDHIAAAYESMVVNLAVVERRLPTVAVRERRVVLSPVTIPETDDSEPAYKYKPEHQFFGGFCTWYAAKKWKEFNGNPVTWSGDGGRWYDNAEEEGRRVSVDPKDVVPGAIIVWTRVGAAGHVAFVEAVTEDGFYITEMNAKGRWVISDAFIPFSNLDKGARYKFRGFILPE